MVLSIPFGEAEWEAAICAAYFEGWADFGALPFPDPDGAAVVARWSSCLDWQDSDCWLASFM